MRENRTCGSEGGEGKPSRPLSRKDVDVGALRLGVHHDQPAERDPVPWRDQRPRTPSLGASHRSGEGFTKRYELKRLVWMERHDIISAAIQREKTMKHWPRAWKVRLILTSNPQWTDLYEQLG